MQRVTCAVHFSVEYQDRTLNRVTTDFRILVAIPVLIVLGAVWGRAQEALDLGLPLSSPRPMVGWLSHVTVRGWPGNAFSPSPSPRPATIHFYEE
jgi:hypothetical protein